MTTEYPKAAILERSRAFEASYNAGDAQSLVAEYFVGDELGPCASPPGGHPLVRGRAGLVELYARMMPDMPRVELETIDVVIDGALAYELGRAHLTLADGRLVKGRYAVCWLNTPYGWRAKIDFFSADGWDD